MNFNRGMLSDLRGMKQERLESKNKTELAITLINKYHSVPRAHYDDKTKDELRSLIKSEINKLKPNLSNYFRTNIGLWLNNEREWLERS